MLRWLRRRMDWTPEQRANGLAGFISFAALGLLYLEAPPIPAGSETTRLMSLKSRAIHLQSAKPATQVMASVSEPVLPTSVTPGDIEAKPADLIYDTLNRKVALLEQGRTFLNEVPDYTAVFSKQELVGGELLDVQDIYLKCRHQPFSVYLRWLSGDEGREVLYTAGANNGEMIVHGGGWKARLPALSISPSSPLAMQECRYPVTKAGILGTVDIMLDCHREDLQSRRVAKCEQLEDQEFDSRMCSVFVLEYADAKTSPTYRKSITFIDKEWNVPLYTENFGWPTAHETATGDELDEATLIELYTFTEVEFRQQLVNADFEKTNEEYRFH
ncbi:DUF1571 domain-containing protein [bacterium]|nr:DUF1571 domain-containing protein [bacterium]